MCGIIGQFSCTTIKPSVTQEALSSIQHRGPDGNGSMLFETDMGNVMFGHTRLSILDPSESGAQPMQSKCGRYVITFNGEIYNHLDLKKIYLSGQSFNGRSDTETIVELVSVLGVDKTLPLLNGMFGFAIYDKQESKIHLCRDRFGVKPIYYKVDKQSFHFGSEIKPIIKVSRTKIHVSSVSLNLLLQFRYVPSPYTLFEGIKRLEPGHVITFSLKNSNYTLASFVKYPISRFSGSYEEACHQYKEFFQQAVERQLQSDAPVGVLLSGGIDSALIAKFASEKKPGLSAYTVGFEGDCEQNEIKQAKHTADALGLKHHNVIVSNNELWNSFQSAVSFNEEPLGTTSILPMWHLTHNVARDLKVVLTGQGCDEPLGGYQRYRAEKITSQPVLNLLGKLGSPLLKLAGARNDKLRRLHKVLSANSPAERFLNSYSMFDDIVIEQLIGKVNKVESIELIEYWLKFAKREKSAEDMMFIDTRMNLSDDLLLYGDKLSMSASLEARVPALDNELINYIESLPLNYRLTQRQNKRIHRDVARQYLPSEIINRPKLGFEVPFGELLKSDWKVNAEDVLFGSEKLYNYINKDAVNQIWYQHKSGKIDLSRQLFTFMSLSFWVEEHLS